MWYYQVDEATMLILSGPTEPELYRLVATVKAMYDDNVGAYTTTTPPDLPTWVEIANSDRAFLHKLL
jgi:hypothetical protein